MLIGVITLGEMPTVIQLAGLAVVAGWALGPPRAPRPPKVARLGLLCLQCPEGSTSADFLPNSVPGALLDELRTLH